MTEVEVLQDIERLVDEKSAINVKIKSKRDSCQALVVLGSQELVSLSQEYRFMVMTHLWRPTLLTPVKHSWSLDNVVQIAFQQHGSAYYAKIDVTDSLV